MEELNRAKAILLDNPKLKEVYDRHGNRGVAAATALGDPAKVNSASLWVLKAGGYFTEEEKKKEEGCLLS